jgi:hypothetical protein
VNKLIFQVGLLAFFIATVAFGLQHNSLLDTISRAFIVFISVVVTMAGVLVLGIVFASKNKPVRQEERPAPPKSVHTTT